MNATGQATAEFYVKLWRENSVLLERVAAFYRDFMSLVPDACLSDAGRLARRMGGNRALARHEAVCLDAQWGISPARDENFSPAPARVALLPLPQLQLTVALTGMTLCREDVTRAVARSEVQTLRDMAGQGAHAFALGRAATYASHARRLRDEAAGMGQDAPHFDTLPLPQRVMAWGMWCVCACSTAGGLSLSARVRLMLGDTRTGSPWAAFSSQSGAAHVAWPLVRVLIFKEISCQWEGGWPSFFA